MVKIISRLVVCAFSCCLILIFSACMSQIAVDKNTSAKTISPNLSQASNKSSEHSNIDTQDQKQKEKPDAKLSNDTFSDAGQTQKNRPTAEDEQDIMEKSLDLLEVADNYWEKGDVENTINTLDKAYALILDADGDVAISRQKDDLRLLISKRLLSVYSAKQTATHGKASEIPLTMNEAVEKEIHCFQTVERDFFIAAYQRSGMYRPGIITELKKARIPEELSWLPFVESGFQD